MDLQIQPLSTVCWKSGRAFAEGDRVVCFLVRNAAGDVVRYDLLEAEAEQFNPEGVLACRWVIVFKPRRANENPERNLKLTAETLFLTLADPAAELNTESTRMLQLLALMLERKRVVRPKGMNPERTKNLVEHIRTKAIYEVPVGELTPEFFVQVQEQLSVLVGGPSVKPASVAGTATPTVAPLTESGPENPDSSG